MDNILIENDLEEVLNLLNIINEEDTEGLSSETKKQQWGGVYYDKLSHESIGKTVSKIQNEASRLFGSTNALYPSVWPSIANMQKDLISLCVDFCKGKHNAQKGLCTSGGTESILLSLLAHREWAYSKGIKFPEIIAASTCHGACHKACFYFGMKLILVKPDEATQRISAVEVEPYINENTIMIYCSAPTFPHGVVDDVQSLSSLAYRRKIGLHIDNCLGGILLQCAQKSNLLLKNGYANAAANGFENIGVTSMSIDLHKYGFSSKGVSAVVFRNNHLRQFVFHPVAPVNGGAATGGGYITPTLAGSRSGAPIAASWATMKFMSKHFSRIIERIHKAYLTIKYGARLIEGIDIVGDTEICVVSFRSSIPSKVTNRQIAKRMRKKGWDLFSSENPSSCGICIGEQHIYTCDKFCKDLTATMAELRKVPKTRASMDTVSSDHSSGVYQAAQANVTESKMKRNLIRFIENGLDRNTHHRTKEFTNLIDEFENSSRL